jgi:ADP-heptose:LPS heptosyltransferase
MIVGIKSFVHIGDYAFLTGVARNIRAQYPNFMFKFIGRDGYKDLFLHNPDFTDEESDMDLPLIKYGTRDDEIHASNGNLVESYTRNVCNALGIAQVPFSVRTPVFTLTDEEIASQSRFRGSLLVNANHQTCSVSKGYPHGKEAGAELVKTGIHVVQVGGNEERDVTTELDGVEDMRGKTSIRQYLGMVYNCACILTPPSGIQNLGAAWGKPTVVVMGCREPNGLTDYPNCVYLRSSCDHANCMCQHKEDCHHWLGTVCKCQADIPPSRVIDAVKRIMR